MAPLAAAPSPAARPRPRGRALVALGVRLASAGILARISLGIGVFTVFAAIVIAATMAATETRPPLELVPSLASSALAWGAGITYAFAAAAHAFRNDRANGVRELAILRGAGSPAYVAARVGGLALVLFVLVAGGSVVVGLASMLAARGGHVAVLSMQTTLASVVYAIAFAAVVAPIALAALGARSRPGGYVWLLALLVVPEIFSGWTAQLLPSGWSDVVSVPAALAALRASLMPVSGIDPARFLRAVLVLSIVTAFALALVWEQAARVETEPRQEAP